MYRASKDYEALDRLAIEIYCDYGFNTFPLDLRVVCHRLGVMLVPYSAFPSSARALLRKRSRYGFLMPRSLESPATIFYNDDREELRSEGCIRQTIIHEIKHYVCDDKDDEDDDLAEHFGKYFAAPIPHLIVRNINSPNEIVSRFGVSMTVASNIASQVRNRRAKYGDHIFDYEKPLIELLDPMYYMLYLED